MNAGKRAFAQAQADLFGFTPPPSSPYPDGPGAKEKGGTSEAAAAAIADTAATLRLRVLRLLRAGYEMTADEIARELRVSMLSIRPRVSELHKAGWIEKTGERRKNASGMSAAIWRACR